MGLTIAVSGLHMGENPQPGAATIRSLRRRFDDLHVIGLIYDPLESGIYADDGPDEVYRMPWPKAGADALLARLDEIQANSSIDILIPSLDSEIHGYLTIEDALTERGIRMMLPGMHCWESCRKSELYALAMKCECRTPVTYSAVDLAGVQKAAWQIGFPLFIKGPYYEAYLVYTMAALVDRFHQIITAWGGPVVLQQSILGEEYDVIGVGDGKGKLAGSCAMRKTIVTQKGKGFGGVTIQDKELDAIVSRIVHGLEWRGPIELEFIKASVDGLFYLIEINPRFPAWVDFPSQVGHNLPALLVDALTSDEFPSLPPHPTGKLFVRHSIDVVGDVTQLGQLSSHGVLRFMKEDRSNG